MAGYTGLQVWLTSLFRAQYLHVGDFSVHTLKYSANMFINCVGFGLNIFFLYYISNRIKFKCVYFSQKNFHSIWEVCFNYVFSAISQVPTKIFINEKQISSCLGRLSLDNNNLDGHPDFEEEPWFHMDVVPRRR